MRNPYYIIAPRYVRTSGGVRVLYRLCDLINKAGGSAFIFLWPSFNHDLASSPMDVAPFLNRRIVDYHFKNGLTPIVIYPETFPVSKFHPPLRVRYLLNYDELLFKNEPLEWDDYLLAYSESIAEHIRLDKPSSTLFLTVSDPIFFCPPPKPVERSGGVFYAGKFKYHFGGKTFSLTDGMHEITRDRPDSQTPEQIRELFWNAEFFYCYEDSALALEAILCGCPVVFLPNEHFQRPLGKKELDGLGFAWGATPEQMRHAKDTVVAARERHLAGLEMAQKQVSQFMEKTQEIARQRPYEVPFAANYILLPGRAQRIIDAMRMLRDAIKEKGWIGVSRIVWKRILSGRFNLY